MLMDDMASVKGMMQMLYKDFEQRHQEMTRTMPARLLEDMRKMVREELQDRLILGSETRQITTVGRGGEGADPEQVVSDPSAPPGAGTPPEDAIINAALMENSLAT